MAEPNIENSALLPAVAQNTSEAPVLPAARDFCEALASSQARYAEISQLAAAFAGGSLRGPRTALIAERQTHEAALREWLATISQLIAHLERGTETTIAARKAEFRWDQRMNPFSRRKHEARAAYDNEQTLSQRGAQLQFEMRSALQRIGYLSQQLESRLLPLLVMRLGQAELLEGTSLGIVRAAVGTYGGFGFGLRAMLDRHRDSEVQSFARAARQLQHDAASVGADAVVGVRWLQCDEFEIEEHRDDNRTEYRRVQRHKPFEALLCGTAVRSSPVSSNSALEAGQAPFEGHLFCSTVREAPHGAVVVENLGIVQGVGVNANWAFTFSPTQATQNLATSEALAFTEAYESLLAAAREIGANAVLGVKPEEPFHRMCVLRGTAVRLAVCSDASRAQPLARMEGFLPPSSLQTPPANLHVIETVGLVSAVGMRPPRWFTWNNPAQTEEESFYNAAQGLSAQAMQMGANAVVGVKWMHDNDRFVSQVVGTAVVLGQLPLPTPHLELAPSLQAFASTLREPPQGFRVASVVGIAVAASMSPAYSFSNWQSRLTAQGEAIALQDAVRKLQASAGMNGAHAILGVKIETLSVYNCSRFMIVVRGTAVRLAQHDEAAELLPFHGDRVEISSMQMPAAHLCVARVHGLVCAVGYRPWRFAWGFRSKRRQDAENEQTTFAAAVQALVEQARAQGANGVMGIKWQHDDDHRSSCLVGTAVTLAQKPGARPPATLGSGQAPFITTSRAPPAGLKVAHTLGVVSGAGMSQRIFAIGAQDRADVDREAFDGAMTCLQQNVQACQCDAILGMKMESPEPGLVILRGTAVQLTRVD